MTDLRKAAERALEALEDIFGKEKKDVGAINALRQALSQNDLEEAIAKGTKAWADVPNASEWVDDLRGNVDNVYMSEERVHKTDKSIHEPVAYVTDSGKSAYILLGVDLEDDTPLYTAPPKREWVGLTDEEKEQATGWSVEHIEAKLKEKNHG